MDQPELQANILDDIQAGKQFPQLRHGMPAGIYGIFMEELSHAFDGGIYGELVQNRSFEEGVLPPGLKLITRMNFAPVRFMRGMARLTSAKVTSNGVSTVLAQFMIALPKQ